MEEADPGSHFSSSLATANRNTTGGCPSVEKADCCTTAIANIYMMVFRSILGGISRSTYEGKSTSRMMGFPSIWNEYRECLPVLNYMELCFEEGEDQAVTR